MLIDLVKAYLREYAIYVNTTRSTPSLDGFKAVQRRIYYVTYKMAKDKFVKTATIAGNVVAYYHPHGTASVEDAIVTMVRNGWLEGQGNWGSRTGLEEIKPAAPRYTEVKFNDKLEWTMKLIKYADYVKTEIDYDEPMILPSPIPIGLIGDLVNFPQHQQGIGIGIRVSVPLYKLSDLIKVVKDLAQKKEPEAPMPYVGRYYDIVSHDADKIFNIGEGRVRFRPKFKLEGKQLILYACSKNLLKIIEPWKDKLSVKDLSKPDVTHIIIEPKKYVRIDFEDVAHKILQKLEDVVTYNVYVSVRVKDKHLVVKLPVKRWLMLQFAYAIEVRKRYIDDMISKVSETLAEVKLIKELRPYLVEYLKTTTKPDVKEFLQTLPNTFDRATIETLLKKYSIRKLLTVDLDEKSLLQELEKWKQEKQSVVSVMLDELDALNVS